MNWKIPRNIPNLAQSEAHVWLIELPYYYQQVARMEMLLTEQELKRAKQFINKSLYDRFVIVRGLLKILISKYLRIKTENVIFNHSSNGKPYINEQIQFNISHSQDLAVFAFTQDIPVGIDVEFKREIEELEAISERYFTRDEWQVIQSISKEKRLEHFYYLWVRKEAIIKAVGGRLFEFLEQSRQAETDPFEGKVTLYPFFTHTEYASALAVKGGAIVIDYWRLPIIGLEDL